MRHFAGPLPHEQDCLQRAAGDEASVIERGPEPRNLTIGEDALAALGGVAVNASAGIAGNKLLLHAQEKIAEMAAKVWFATTGASMLAIIVLMSGRVIVAA